MTDLPKPFRRARSQADRDRLVRKDTPATGIPAHYECDDVTGRYQGEELDRVRSRRPTPERLRILEQKHDKLDATVADIRADVAKMSGQVGLLVSLAQAREDRWKHIAPIIKAIGIAVAAIVAAYFGHGALK